MAHAPYASDVGSLMYGMVCTRLDIAHTVGVLSRYMLTLGKEHWIVIKRVFRYLFGTTNYSICYQGKPKTERKLDVHGFVDSDWAGDVVARRSTNGYVFKLFGGTVSWMSRRQLEVALLTTEA